MPSPSVCAATHTAAVRAHLTSACIARNALHPLPLRLVRSQARPFSSGLVSVAKCVASQPQQSATYSVEQLSSSHICTAAASGDGAGDSLCASTITGSARALELSVPLWLVCSFPALAADTGDFSQGSAASGSYYATLFLFVATLPGAGELQQNGSESLT